MTICCTEQRTARRYDYDINEAKTVEIKILKTRTEGR
jgi:hypothetical protein